MKAKSKRSAVAKVQFTLVNGKPKPAIMDAKHYQAPLGQIEDLRDSLDLKDAIERSTGFVTLGEFRKELASQRKR